MLCKTLIAAHHIVPSDLSRVQNHGQLKLIESHNCFVSETMLFISQYLEMVQMIRQTGIDVF